MKTKYTLLFLGALLITISLQAQQKHKIYTKDNKVIDAHILEQNNKETKYINPAIGPATVFIIPNRQIEKIEYENGITDLMGNDNPRISRPLGINAGLSYYLTSEVAFYNIGLNYFILPQVELQINAGIEADGDTGLLSFGGNFHLAPPYSTKKITPYSGLHVGTQWGEAFIQVPLGINFIGSKGFNVAFSVNELVLLQENWNGLFAELTIGYRFKL